MEREGSVRKTGGYDPPDPGDIFRLTIAALAESMETLKQKSLRDGKVLREHMRQARLDTLAYHQNMDKLNQENKAYFARLETSLLELSLWRLWSLCWSLG